MAKKARKYTSEQQETTLQADGRSYKLYLNDIAHNALIFNGDCIDVMSSEIVDSSIDCILTDPPYNLGNYMHERNTNMVKMRRNSFAYAGWDNMDYQEWATQMRNFFSQCYRVLKKRGTMIVFMSIRKDIISFLNDNYEFYKLDADYIDIDTPQGTVSPKFIDYFYKILTGKIYKEDEYGSLILAFEKHPKDKTAKDRILSEITPYLNKPIEQFELQDRID